MPFIRHEEIFYVNTIFAWRGKIAIDVSQIVTLYRLFVHWQDAIFLTIFYLFYQDVCILIFFSLLQVTYLNIKWLKTILSKHR